MESFEKLLEVSTEIHGHVCPGQVLGVRLAMLGLQAIGIDDPKGMDQKNLYVIVEIDRCATDAIQSVTGCSIGKRTLFLQDNGVMAATFVHLRSGKAVRVVALEESRELSKKYFEHIADTHQRQLQAYKIMPDNELFRLDQVEVDIPKENLPGKPTRRVQCEQCGDWVQDSRDVEVQGKTLCRNCAEKSYFTKIVSN